jgi:hypothetical protein
MQSVPYFYYKPDATTKCRGPSSNSKSLGVSHFDVYNARI